MAFTDERNERAKEFSKRVSEIIANISNSSSENIRSMIEKLRTAQNGIYNIADGEITSYNSEELNEFLNDFENVRQFLASYRNDNQASKQDLENLKELNELFGSELARETYEAAKERNRIVSDYQEGLWDIELLKQYEKLGTDGIKPGIDDCINLSIYNDDTDKTFGNIVWLMNTDYKAERLYGNKKTGIYIDTLDRIIDEILSAPIPLQMEYANKLTMRMASTRDECLDLYNKCYNRKYDEIYNSVYDGEIMLGMDEEQAKLNAKRNAALKAEEFAHVQLVKSPMYTAALAANQFAGKFFSTRMASFLMSITQEPHKDGKMNYSERESTVIYRMIKGDMSQYLTKHHLMNMTQQAMDFEIRDFGPELEQSGLTGNDDIAELTSQYVSLAKDTEAMSGTMTAMRDTLKDFIVLNHGEPGSVPDYREKLNAALDAAKRYADSHSGYRFTDNGKLRQRIANNLVSELTALNQKLYGAKTLDLSGFKTTSEPYSKLLQKAANEAHDKQITRQDFVSMLMNLENPDDLNDKGNPPDEEQLRIHNTARRNIFEAAYDSMYPAKIIEAGIKYDELDAAQAEVLLKDRELLDVIFDYGDDPTTIRKNLSAAYRIVNADMYKDDIAALIKKRVDEISYANYDRFMDMTPQELAQNYQEYAKNIRKIRALGPVVARLRMSVPAISDETLGKAQAISERYGNMIKYHEKLMEFMACPEILNKELEFDRMRSISECFRLTEEKRNSNPGEERANRTAVSAGVYRALLFTDRLKRQMAKNPDSFEELNDIRFYDEYGDEVDDLDVLDHAKAGNLIAANINDPQSAKAFEVHEDSLLPAVKDYSNMDVYMDGIKSKLAAQIEQRRAIDHFTNLMDESRIPNREEYEMSLANGWADILLANPDIDGDTVLFINDALMSTDKVHGRMRIYDYAVNEILEMRQKIEDEAISPYIKAMGYASRLLIKQMAMDGYEIPRATLQEMMDISDELCLLEADPGRAISDGKKLNIYEKITEGEKKAVSSLIRALESGDRMKIIKESAAIVGFNAMKEAGCTTPEKMKEIVREKQTPEMLQDMGNYINVITIDKLKKFADQPHFASQFAKGFKTMEEAHHMRQQVKNNTSNELKNKNEDTQILKQEETVRIMGSSGI